MDKQQKKALTNLHPPFQTGKKKVSVDVYPRLKLIQTENNKKLLQK